MITFLLVGGALTLLVLAGVLLPLLRGGGEAPARVEFDRAVYRDQLRELERDAARGMIGVAEAAAARLEIQRRLLGRAPAADPARLASTRRNPVLALVLGLLVTAGAGGLYWLTGAPGIPAAPIAGRPADAGAANPGAADPKQTDPEAGALLRAMAELEQRLAAEPANGEGWLLLARTASSLGQWARSADAYRRALALLPATPAMLEASAEAMVLAAGGIVSPAAREAFAAVLARTPDSQVARFYLATADAQAGRAAAAIAVWQALAAELPAGAPIRDEIARRIAAVARDAGIVVPALSGPREAPLPQAGDAMIRAMVAGLAARLAADPNDADGWLRLGRSYVVLGDAAGAQAAFAKAAALRPDDLSIPLAEAQALLEGLAPTAPFPPRALEQLRRVAAADPRQPSALWHLGVEAAKRGAPAEAAGYWERLLAVLPAEGDDATMVRSALAAVRRQ